MITEPMIRSMPPKTRSNPVRLWKEHIEPLTGCHPALIQAAAHSHWQGFQDGYKPDPLHIRMGAQDHLRDLWERRTAAEKGLLFLAAEGKSLPQGALHGDLVQRGLITTEDSPFSQLFTEFIKEQPHPAGKDQKWSMDDVEKGAAHADRWINRITDWADKFGKPWRAFRDGDNKKSSNSNDKPENEEQET